MFNRLLGSWSTKAAIGSVLLAGLLALPVALGQGSPITIGASLSLTGNYARNGQDEQKGYELWVQQINANGGLLGRQVKLIVYDDQSEPATGAKLIERLITKDHVDLLIGPYSSSVTMAATTVSEKYHMVMLNPGASSLAIFQRGYKYAFQLLTPARLQMHAGLELAQQNGFKSVAIIYQDSAFPKDLALGANQSAKQLGMNVVLDQSYATNATDFSSLILRLRQANPDVLVAGSYLPDSIQLVRQIRDSGWAPKMFLFGPNGPALPDFEQTLGKDADGIMGISQWEPVAQYPGAQAFVKAYEQRFGAAPSYSSAAAYSAAEILQRAVEKVGSLNQDQIRQVLLNADWMTPFGAFKVDSTGAQTAHKTVIIQVQNGAKQIVWPKEAASASPVLPFQGWK